jgi:hypothetical protein
MASLYESPWHVPGTPWLVSLAFLAVLAASPGRRRGLFASLAILVAVDAWLNGPLTPLAGATAPVRTGVGLAFVLVGDFRYFLVAELAASGGAGAWRRALLFTFVVPLVALPVRLLDVPERVLWLVYETAFLVLALVLRHVVWPRRLRGGSGDVTAAVRALTTFQVVQYGLWASADVMLLAGLDAGWLVRLVPNILYYGAFVPFAWWWLEGAEGERR